MAWHGQLSQANPGMTQPTTDRRPGVKDRITQRTENCVIGWLLVIGNDQPIDNDPVEQA